MAAVPIKPEYGPTLGRLLAPRWRSASRAVRVDGDRAATRAGGAHDRGRAHAGERPLLPRRQRPVQLQLPRPLPRRARPGRLRQGAAPQRRRAARGILRRGSAAPAALQRRTVRRDAAVRRELHPRARAGAIPASSCAARARRKSTACPPTTSCTRRTVEGRKMFGRDVLLLREAHGAREGVAIAILLAKGALPSVIAPAGSGHGRHPRAAAEELQPRLGRASRRGELRCRRCSTAGAGGEACGTAGLGRRLFGGPVVVVIVVSLLAGGVASLGGETGAEGVAGCGVPSVGAGGASAPARSAAAGSWSASLVTSVTSAGARLGRAGLRAGERHAGVAAAAAVAPEPARRPSWRPRACSPGRAFLSSAWWRGGERCVAHSARGWPAAGARARRPEQARTGARARRRRRGRRVVAVAGAGVVGGDGAGGDDRGGGEAGDGLRGDRSGAGREQAAGDARAAAARRAAPAPIVPRRALPGAGTDAGPGAAGDVRAACRRGRAELGEAAAS